MESIRRNPAEAVALGCQAVILAAGRGTRMRAVTRSGNKSLVLVEGKPLLLHTIMLAAQCGANRFVVVLRPEEEVEIGRQLRALLAPLRLELVTVAQPEQRGPGHAIAMAVPHLSAGPVTVFLGDAYIKEALPLGTDWVGVAKVREGGAWCRVEVDSSRRIVRFWDKCDAPRHVEDIAIGVYSFSRSNALAMACQDVLARTPLIAGEIQISSVLEAYATYAPLSAYRVATWQDAGDRKSYHAVFRQTMPHRNFHTVTVDHRGIVTKTIASGDLQDEISWYRSLGPTREHFAPRLFREHLHSRAYDIEFLDLPTLAHLFLFEQVEPDQFAEICKELVWQLSSSFWKPVPELPLEEQIENCRSMYVRKTEQRFGPWLRESGLDVKSSILFRGQPMLRVDDALDYLLAELNRISARPVWGFIHGDLHFSNILYSPTNGHFRLIDPRGRFGAASADYGGDVRYDLAKLRHSYHSLYDAFARDLFLLTGDKSEGYDVLLPYTPPYVRHELDSFLSRFVPVFTDVKWIEVALLLSMLPLHSESPKRQLALLMVALNAVTDLAAGVSPCV